MKRIDTYNGGENFDLHSMLLQGRKMNLNDKTQLFAGFINELKNDKSYLNFRCLNTATGREVIVLDPIENKVKKMLMFGSNNYLGLADHPYVKEKVKIAIDQYGAGVAGPPLLNGYTYLHKKLEEKLAQLKGAEDSLIYSSGYNANVGLVSALCTKNSFVVYDSFSHASFCDGLKMTGAIAYPFHHNNMEDLEHKLSSIRAESDNDIFVGVEGVYSMDGDLAPLDLVTYLCHKYNAYLIVDDAHGTGVMGKTGKGTAEFFRVESLVDVTMGTFSKTFAATGGFVASSKDIVKYLRFLSRSYMFSASIPPATCAAVLSGIEVMEDDHELIDRLKENCKYTAKCLTQLGFAANSETPIFPLLVPEGINIRKAAVEFHKLGIFVNSVEYPAVPLSQQRFRISVIASHTKDDIDMLADAVDKVWKIFKNELAVVM